MTNRQNIIAAFFLVAGTVAVGYVVVWIGGKFKYNPNAMNDLLGRLQQMALLTVVIERVVEVYLGVSQQNGPDRHDPPSDQSGPNAKRPASIAALVLGLLVATSVRLLETFGTVEVEGNWGLANAIWTGVDIVLSGGLLAGGSFLIHEVMESIKGGIKRVDPSRTSSVADRKLNSGAYSSDTMGRWQLLPPTHRSVKAQYLIDRCEAIFEVNKHDGSAFVSAVAAAGGARLSGQADDIVRQMQSSIDGWMILNDGVQAAEMADMGMLVIAGLKGSEHRPAKSAGQVAIVASGAVADGRYPTAYWGSSGGGPTGKNQTINHCWNAHDLEKVHYAARSI